MYKTYQFDSKQKPKIKDLCLEDKKKIGKLINKLAQEREEKEILLKKLTQIQQSEQKQQRLQTEIEKLDEEISQLQDQEMSSQTPQLQTQSKQKLLNKFENDNQNIHQSPNFKILNQINQDQSSSFIIPITQRESPIKIDQQIQTSMVQQQNQQYQPIEQQKKSKTKKKKEILMKKIQEFEKIINRLNFSNEQSIELTTNRKSEDQNSQLNNTSCFQTIFQKLLNIEQQSVQNQQTIKSEQQSEIQQNQLIQQLQQYSEDDLIIQLLNSDTSSYQSNNQFILGNKSNVSKQVQQYSRNNTLNIQNENKLNKQKVILDQIQSPSLQDGNCKIVVQKYNSLLQELN